MKRMLAATVLVGMVWAGCGGDTSSSQQPGTMPPPNTVDPNGVTPPPPASNGLCNDVTPAGGAVSDQLAATVPALNGGTIADGRYVLSKYEWYTPNMLHTRSITMVISGGGKFAQYLWQRDQEPEQRVTVTIATNADRIAMRGVCPVGEDLEWDRYGMGADGGLTLYSTRDSKAAFFAHQ
jgi:hypothetical protein